MYTVQRDGSPLGGSNRLSYFDVSGPLYTMLMSKLLGRHCIVQHQFLINDTLLPCENISDKRTKLKFGTDIFMCVPGTSWTHHIDKFW